MADNDEKKPEKKRLSRRLKTVVIEIEEENGEIRDYTIKELTGPQRDAFIKSRDKYMEGNNIKPEMLSAAMTELLGKTLYGPDGKLVAEGEILNLPSDTQLELFQDAFKLSGLDKGAKQAAKND